MQVPFNVPTQLSEIKLSDYQKFMEIAESNKEDEAFVRQKMVQIFCNVPLLAVNKMKRKDFVSVSNTVAETLNQRSELKMEVEIRDIKFGFIPNLDDMSFGEFADLDGYMEGTDELDKAMAVLYRPIIRKHKGKYLIEEYAGSKKYSDLMGDITMDIVIGAIVFFWTLNNQFLAIIPKYFKQQALKNKKVQADLEKNGDGISTYINSLEETCSKLTKLSRFPLERHLLS